MRRADTLILAYTAAGARLARRLAGQLDGACLVCLHRGHAEEELSSSAAGAQRPAVVSFSSTSELLAEYLPAARRLLYISATGIAVRTIAPYLTDKAHDPAVLVMDDTARYVIPLLSGHLGGANAWAAELAALSGAEAVITTATDRHGVFAVDLYAREHQLVVAEPALLREVSGALLHRETIGWYVSEELRDGALGALPAGLRRVDVEALPEGVSCVCAEEVPTDARDAEAEPASEDARDAEAEPALEGARDAEAEPASEDARDAEAEPASADTRDTDANLTLAGTQGETAAKDAAARQPRLGVTITEREGLAPRFARECRLYPRNLCVGLGCRRGIALAELRRFLRETLRGCGLTPERVCALASVERKKDEGALIALAEELRVPFLTYSSEELRALPGEYSASAFVETQVGVDNVCERSAVAAAGAGAELIARKHARDGMTLAVARMRMRRERS